MRGKSNMENRKNTQPTKIHSQRYPWAGSMDPDWIWSRWSYLGQSAPASAIRSRDLPFHMQGSASPSGEPICALMDSVTSTYSIARVDSLGGDEDG